MQPLEDRKREREGQRQIDGKIERKKER